MQRHAILIASVYSQNIIHGIYHLPNGAGLLFIVCFLSQTTTFLKIHGFVFLHRWPIKPLFVKILFSCINLFLCVCISQGLIQGRKNNHTWQQNLISVYSWEYVNAFNIFWPSFSLCFLHFPEYKKIYIYNNVKKCTVKRGNNTDCPLKCVSDNY